MTGDRMAFHEAGHSVVAWRVGRRLGPVTIVPMDAADGCSWSNPRKVPAGDFDRLDPGLTAMLWPARIRRHIETACLVSLAGNIAAELALDLPRRTPPTVSERLPALSAADRTAVTQAAAATTMSPDDATIAEYAAVWSLDDPRVAGPWLDYLEAETRRLVRSHADRIERVAAALTEHRTLGARAVRTLIDKGN